VLGIIFQMIGDLQPIKFPTLVKTLSGLVAQLITSLVT
jgi:hypothetical protein